MAVPITRKSMREAISRPDPSWKDLYRVGGVSALLYVLLYLVAIGLVFALPLPPTSGGEATLQYIADNRFIYIVEQVLWLVPSVLAMLVFLALYMALKDLNKSYAAIGALIGIASWALAVALPTTGGGSPSLVYLSDQYQAATTAAQRAAFATAAEDLIAQNNIPSAVGIMTTIGLLIVALVMLKGVFPKVLAYLGIITGSLGIVSEILRPILGISYTFYGVLLLVWFGMVGWKLYRLGQALG